MPADALPEEIRRDLEAMDAALAGTTPEPELTELGRLALAVREERPEAPPEFTRELDARAAAGFPRRRPLGRWREKLGARPLLLVPGTALAGVLAVAVAVSVVTSGGTTSTTADGGGTVGLQEAAPERDAAAGAEDAVGGSTSAPSGTSLPVPPVPPQPGGGSPRSDSKRDRLVERSATLTLTAAPDELEETADGVVAVTDRLGGFVVSSSVSATTDGGSGEFLVRVPSSRLQQALAELSRLGHVAERRQSVQDITREGVSAQDRLEEAQAERRSLLRRLKRAQTDEETARLRRLLRAVNLRVDGAETDLARVRNRAAFSNISVALRADAQAGQSVDDGVWSPGDAARDALRVLEVAVGVVLIALAVLLPLGLLAALGLLAGRRAARRGRERALDAV